MLSRRVIITGLVATSVTGVRAARPTRIALIQVNEQAAYFNAITNGVRQACSENGCILDLFNADNSPIAQIDALETYIQARVDAILICAIDINGVRDGIEQARRAGIIVIAIDAIVPGQTSAQIGVDNEAGSAALLKATIESRAFANVPNVQVGVVGAVSSYIQTLRAKGFSDAMHVKVPHWTLAGIVDGQNMLDAAQTAAEDLIAAYPEMRLIFATGEPALIGTLSALKTTHANPALRVVGWDPSPAGDAAMKAGIVLGMVQQDTSAMGSRAVEAALQIRRGLHVSHDLNVPMTIMTAKGDLPV